MIILKKIFKLTFFLILCVFSLDLVFNTCLCFNEVENENDESYEISELITSLQASTTVAKEPETNSSHIIVIDRNSLRILYEKNAFEKTPMASTTKILTSIIAIEHCSLGENVNISAKAASTSGSTLGIINDTTMTMRDLLYGLMLRSRK